MPNNWSEQKSFPREPREPLKVESPNGIGRVSGNRVTISSYEPGETVGKLPYRDTVTGRYRER